MSLRDEFEAWFDEFDPKGKEYGFERDGDGYQMPHVQDCWLAYQSATERALRIVRKTQGDTVGSIDSFVEEIERRIKGDDSNG